ncbi:PREDICTED: uncharacterized protein LOC108522422 [Rhinopithecus bieti]|uniref:uncharacterized protein LOC108522422 n=1 Tax=Rhinopithecus bieti TaxID=61621 RepID=UPI00083C8D10|nr:PREDICTED: uncharacterized protein LOC108522422 [Rhinopithecus bieti]
MPFCCPPFPRLPLEPSPAQLLPGLIAAARLSRNSRRTRPLRRPAQGLLSPGNRVAGAPAPPPPSAARARLGSLVGSRWVPRHSGRFPESFPGNLAWDSPPGPLPAHARLSRTALLTLGLAAVPAGPKRASLRGVSAFGDLNGP